MFEVNCTADNTDKNPDRVPLNPRLKLLVDGRGLVFYDSRNTGKEVILKYMSSYHSEVAAA